MSASILLRRTIKAHIEKHGGLRNAARKLNIDPAYLSRLMSGEKKNPSRTTLAKLGLFRVETYQRLK